MSETRAQNDYPYLQFGQHLRRARKAKKLTTSKLCEELELTKEEYQNFELGKVLPGKMVQVEIADILDVDLEELISWTTPSQTVEQDQKAFSSKYEAQLNQIIEQLKTEALKDHKSESDEASDALDQLKKEILNYSNCPPSLPEDIVLLLEILFRQSKQFEHLHEYQGLFAEGENLANYLARVPGLACFFWHKSNELYFKNNPIQSMEETIHQLTFTQFQELIYLATFKEGIYDHEDTLAKLQKHADICSIASLMTRELKPYVQEYLNYEHLYMAVQMIHIGEKVVHSIFYSHLRFETDRTDGKEIFKERVKKQYDSFSDELIQKCLAELPGLVSAIFAEKWGFPEAVSDALLSYSSISGQYLDLQPLVNIDPFCSTLALVLFYTECFFVCTTLDKAEEVLANCPGVEISAKELFKAGMKMAELRHSLTEVSSTMLEQTTPNAVVAGKKALDRMVALNFKLGDMDNAERAEQADPRTTGEYQHALIDKAKELLTVLKDRLIANLLADKIKTLG